MLHATSESRDVATKTGCELTLAIYGTNKGRIWFNFQQDVVYSQSIPDHMTGLELGKVQRLAFELRSHHKAHHVLHLAENMPSVKEIFIVLHEDEVQAQVNKRTPGTLPISPSLPLTTTRQPWIFLDADELKTRYKFNGFISFADGIAVAIGHGYRVSLLGQGNEEWAKQAVKDCEELLNGNDGRVLSIKRFASEPKVRIGVLGVESWVKVMSRSNEK